MIKVSVIIPVYGVEQYIERCARSLFSQTLNEIEFIFVDDFSPDNSISILQRVLEEYPLRRKSVRIIHHEENLGLPAARATGSRFAQGEYIAHCDSDDWVDQNMYNTLYEYAKSKDYDLVVCNIIYENGKYSRQLEDRFSGSKWDYFAGVLKKNNQPMVWNKLYKRNLNDLISYPRYNMGEDLVTTVQLAFHAKSIGYCSQYLYHYCIHQQSMSNVPTSHDVVYHRFQQVLKNGDQLFSFLEHHNLERSYKKEIEYLKLLKKNYLIPLLGEETYRVEWLRTYPEIHNTVLFNPLIPLKEKLRFFYYLIINSVRVRINHV